MRMLARPAAPGGPGAGRRGARTCPTPAPSEVFVEEAWRDAADSMQRLYREEGWIDARVSLVGLEQNVPGRTFTARFHIEEGVRTHVASVRFVGFPAGVTAARAADAEGGPAVQRSTAPGGQPPPP